VLLTVETFEEPKAEEGERVAFKRLGAGLYRLIIRFGYMEHHDLPAILTRVRISRKSLDPMMTTYYLGKESLVPARVPLLPKFWRAIFIFLVRNARDASSYFNLPVNRVVELGMQMEI
jgi:KUP system potassium uptake protein